MNPCVRRSKCPAIWQGVRHEQERNQAFDSEEFGRKRGLK
jgi:hypothetical protein